MILNSPAVSDPARGGVNPAFGTGRDIAGIVLFVIGLFWEALGDIQKVSSCSKIRHDRGGSRETDQHSTCLNHPNRQRDSHAPRVYGTFLGKSRFTYPADETESHDTDTRLTLARFSSTGACGCYAVSQGTRTNDPSTPLMAVSPSTNATTTTGARRAQYAAIASPLLTMAL